MYDDLSEEFLDYSSLDPAGCKEPVWRAEVFHQHCKRRAAAAEYGEVDLEFQLMVGMRLLGPEDWPPPRHVYEHLRRTVLDQIPLDKRQERLFDAIMAFGCGWRRGIESAASGWEARWPGALRSLTVLAARSVRSADYKLRRVVGLGGSDGSEYKPGSSSEAVAYQLVMQLVRPVERLCLEAGESFPIVARENAIEIGREVEVPPGGKYVLEVDGQGAFIEIKVVCHGIAAGARVVIACRDWGTEIKVSSAAKTFRLKPGDRAHLCPGRVPAAIFVRECTCGSIRCAERHRIESWNPQFSLRAFVAVAVKGVKPRGGNTPPGLVSLQQGMYYQHLNRGTEALVGDKRHRLHLRLRLVSAAVKQCTCGSVFLEDICPECGDRFDPFRMKMVKKKAFLILEGRCPEDQTRLEQLGKCFVRKGFLRCNDKDAAGKRTCDNYFELTDSLWAEQVYCRACGQPIYQKEELPKWLPTAATRLQLLKRLQAQRRRLVKRQAKCPHCGKQLHEVSLQCPLCCSCQLGQNLVFLYERKPPLMIVKPGEAAAGDGPDDVYGENAGPVDGYKEEVEYDA